ncbi:cell adhesion molecule 2-like [Amphiura filiformis]|uniref:cell adhesion molecule 2-like n=1 Tax=Amphiura filiformis TaxID=82378 RepID=UPI003B20BD8E
MALYLITLQLLLVVLPFLDPNGVTMATKGPFVEEPKNRTVTIGGTVSFPCIRDPEEDCTVLWYSIKSQKYLTRNKALMQNNDNTMSGHYSLSGIDRNDFTLTIHNVSLRDVGAYQCVCFVSQTYFSPRAELVVNIPPNPDYPSCRIAGLEETLYVGQYLTFHCSSIGGRPPADLKWIRGMNEVLETDNIKSPSSSSTYRTYLKPEDFGQLFTCVASSPALLMPRKCTVGPLYPTSVVQIDVIPEVETIEGLQPLSFGCSANFSEFGVRNFQPVTNYSWYINDSKVRFGMVGVMLENDRQFMFMNQTTHLPRNTQITCEAFGPYGSYGNATVMINNPKFENESYIEVTEPMVFIVGQKQKQNLTFANCFYQCWWPNAIGHYDSHRSLCSQAMSVFKKTPCSSSSSGFSLRRHAMYTNQRVSEPSINDTGDTHEHVRIY